jgi:hypothetical protein
MRMQGDLLGAAKAARQIVFQIEVHQKTDRPPVHAVDRLIKRHKTVQTFEHKAIPTQGDNGIGPFRRAVAIAVFQAQQRLLSVGRLGGNKGDVLNGHGTRSQKGERGESEYKPAFASTSPEQF